MQKTPRHTTPLAVFDQIRQKLRSKAELGRQLGITPQATSAWWLRQQVPVGWVLKVEDLTGIPRHEIRPDIYPRSE